MLKIQAVEWLSAELETELLTRPDKEVRYSPSTEYEGK